MVLVIDETLRCVMLVERHKSMKFVINMHSRVEDICKKLHTMDIIQRYPKIFYHSLPRYNWVSLVSLFQ